MASSRFQEYGWVDPVLWEFGILCSEKDNYKVLYLYLQDIIWYSYLNIWYDIPIYKIWYDKSILYNKYIDLNLTFNNDNSNIQLIIALDIHQQNMQAEDLVPTAILLGWVQIILHCPPCPDSIISSNMNCGTYSKVSLKTLCRHSDSPRGSLASIINFTQIPKARRMQLTKNMKFWYDMSQEITSYNWNVTWVVFPEPVSPQTTRTSFSFSICDISPLSVAIGSVALKFNISWSRKYI